MGILNGMCDWGNGRWGEIRVLVGVVEGEEVKESVKDMGDRVGGLEYVLDIVGGVMVRVLFGYEWGIGCYWCEGCGELMGDSM